MTLYFLSRGLRPASSLKASVRFHQNRTMNHKSEIFETAQVWIVDCTSSINYFVVGCHTTNCVSTKKKKVLPFCRRNFLHRSQPDTLFFQKTDFYFGQAVVKGFFNCNISFDVWSLRPPFCPLSHPASRSCGKIFILYGEVGRVDNMAANWQHGRHW